MRRVRARPRVRGIFERGKILTRRNLYIPCEKYKFLNSLSVLSRITLQSERRIEKDVIYEARVIYGAHRSYIIRVRVRINIPRATQS